MILRFVKKPVNAWIAHETNIIFVIGVCHIRFLLRFHRIARKTGRSVKKMKYIVLKDRIGRYIFIPIDSKPIDCCGFVRWGRSVNLNG